jgi:RNA polymerase sigma-70 factor (ECF subfamily)
LTAASEEDFRSIVAMSPPPLPSTPATPSDSAASLSRWFADEVQPHDPQLRAYLRVAFPGVRDVDDVVQESYLQLWRNRRAGGVRSVRGFLFHAARHIALNVLRKERNAPFAVPGPQAVAAVPAEAADAADAAVLRERADLLAEAILALPPRCGEIVVLHKVHGLSQREVAARLGLSERTVETQVRTGLARLQARVARAERSR